MAQGRDNARTFLKDNPEMCAEVEEKLRAALFAAPAASAEGKTEERQEDKLQQSAGDREEPQQDQGFFEDAGIF